MVDKVYDAIIIGAGPAGNYLAWELATRGLSPLVIEQRARVGLPLQCAGIMSQKLARLVPLPENIVLNRVSRAEVVAPSGKSALMQGRERPYVIDRPGFDQYLYRRALDAGASYHLEEKFLDAVHIPAVTSISGRKVPGIKLHTSQGYHETPLLVGCDGPLSGVAKFCNVHNSNIYGIQVRAKVPTHDPDVATMHFHARWKELFAWVVPEGDGTCRIGLGTAHHPRDNLKFYLKMLGVSDGDIIDKQAGLIPMGQSHQASFPNVCLLGDAAGHVKATTGGGVVIHLSAAKTLAQAITRIHEKHDGEFSLSNLQRYYEKPCHRSIVRQLKIHYLIRQFMLKFTPTDWDYLIDLYENTPVGKIFNVYGEMDFPKRFFFKLLRDRRITRLLVSFFTRHWRDIGSMAKLLF